MLITLEMVTLHNLPTYNHRVTFKDIRVEVSWCSCSILHILLTKHIQQLIEHRFYDCVISELFFKIHNNYTDNAISQTLLPRNERSLYRITVTQLHL